MPKTHRPKTHPAPKPPYMHGLANLPRELRLPIFQYVFELSILEESEPQYRQSIRPTTRRRRPFAQLYLLALSSHTFTQEMLHILRGFLIRLDSYHASLYSEMEKARYEHLAVLHGWEGHNFSNACQCPKCGTLRCWEELGILTVRGSLRRFGNTLARMAYVREYKVMGMRIDWEVVDLAVLGVTGYDDAGRRYDVVVRNLRGASVMIARLRKIVRQKGRKARKRPRFSFVIRRRG